MLLKGNYAMSMTDPIADMLVRIKNAAAVGKQTVKMPSAPRSRSRIAERAEGRRLHRATSRVDRQSATKPELEIVAEVLRRQAGHRAPRARSPVRACASTAARTRLPKVLDGLGVAIISTSQGHHDRRAGARSRASAVKSCASWLKGVTHHVPRCQKPVALPKGVELNIQADADQRARARRAPCR
mgnify:CR=1 FL=1